MTAPAMYGIAVEERLADGWRPVTEPYMQGYDRTPAELAEAVAENWDLNSLDHPWTIGIFKGGRFDEKLAELSG